MACVIYLLYFVCVWESSVYVLYVHMCFLCLSLSMCAVPRGGCSVSCSSTLCLGFSRTLGLSWPPPPHPSNAPVADPHCARVTGSPGHGWLFTGEVSVLGSKFRSLCLLSKCSSNCFPQPSPYNLNFEIVYLFAHRSLCGGQRITRGSQFSPFAMRVLGTELRLSGLASSIFNGWTILPAGSCEI